ncbi:MAG: FdtA/QdtA family cupin domain-containing protein [bacterium]|jgi:hypothetical protein
MAVTLRIPTFRDENGKLSVLDGDLPFKVRRVYFIHGVPAEAQRAGHRHLRNRQVIVCVHGRCDAVVRGGGKERTFPLDDPGKGLLLEPGDWHLLRGFRENAVLLVLASEAYDPSDYAEEPSVP